VLARATTTIVVAAVSVVAAPAAPAPGADDSGTFRALTYNVAGLPEGLSGSNPSVNTPLISPLLNAYDLVLVQEDWVDPAPPIPGVDFFHDDLISAVTHPYLSTPAVPPNGTDPRRPTALVADGLNQLSRFPFGSVTRTMWPNCFGGANTNDGGAADCLSQKGFSLSRVELAPGISVDVYNLHAEAGSTPLDLQYSAEDFQVLAQYVNANSAGRAVLVGGDYNLHTDEAVDGAVFDTFLAATGLTDVCAVVDCGADSDRIDKFVFRSGGGVDLEPLDHRFERDVFVRADGAPLSDHDALAVTWRWTRQAPGSIAGTVTDAAGAPLAGITVGAYGPLDTWLGSAYAVTDAHGRYTLDGVVPSVYRVVFLAPPASGAVSEWYDDASRRAQAGVVTVAAGAGVEGIDAGLAAFDGGSVAGRVTDAGGAPVAQAQVWAYGTTDGYVGSAAAITNADGTYELAALATGTYKLLFRPIASPGLRAEWYDDAPSRTAGAAVTIASGSTQTGVDAALAPGP
jgi:hypothetical protein